MTQLVPVFNGSPALRILLQDLQSYGIVIVHSICALQRQSLNNLPAEFITQHSDDESEQAMRTLGHFISQGTSERGYGQLDCYTDNFTFDQPIETTHSLIAAAAQQWCTVGKPSRHLAVLFNPTWQDVAPTALTNSQVVQRTHVVQRPIHPHHRTPTRSAAFLL